MTDSYCRRVPLVAFTVTATNHYLVFYARLPDNKVTMGPRLAALAPPPLYRVHHTALHYSRFHMHAARALRSTILHTAAAAMSTVVGSACFEQETNSKTLVELVFKVKSTSRGFCLGVPLSERRRNGRLGLITLGRDGRA
ncbi:hypothetical protein CBL_10420 [Carabus blaptoides fortunei]